MRNMAHWTGVFFFRVRIFYMLLFGSPDDYFKEKKSKEQREQLGLAPAPKGRSASRTPPEPTNALQQVEVHVCD